MAPWAASIALHAGLIAVGLVVVTTVRFAAPEEDESVLVRADFYELAPAPVEAMESTPDVPEPVHETVRREAFEAVIESELAAEPEIALLSDASPPAPPTFAPPPSSGRAEFAGLVGTNAERIVFVVDASGSMIGTLKIVIDELARSLDAMDPSQSFQVIFFQRNEALVVPPAGRLVPATREEKVRALGWIDETIVPRGRSNPLEALRRAMALEPDVIFLLSNNITGSGVFEVDQRDLLAMLEELNPMRPDVNRRRTEIKCVQFLDPDPLDTLRKIAAIHGGENGYRFLSREELGLGVERP